MEKKHHSPSISYVYSIFALYGSWIINWWNTSKSETFLNDIQEKSILEKLIEFEELFLLDEMIKEYPKHIYKSFVSESTKKRSN
uniref:Uncharacterized protein n=1 Tax=Salix viminalis TaxID=40686 RepID=A0A6N2KIN8_SALVM